MDGENRDFLKDLSAVVHDLPGSIVESLAQALESLPNGEVGPMKAAATTAVTHPGARQSVEDLLRAWCASDQGSPSALASLLRGAAAMDSWHRTYQSIELVGSGPSPHGTTLRRTDQALLDLIRSARQKLLIVTYAAYDIPNLRAALLDAIERGVDVHFVVEDPEESGGKVRGDPMRAMGTKLADRATVWIWPREKRTRGDRSGLGLLHAKCAVADESQSLISSANLTGHAMELNIEIGLRVMGEPTARDLSNHFSDLMTAGVLRKLEL